MWRLPLAHRLATISTLVVSVLACSPPSPVADAPPPDVLLLVIDCMRADRLGVAGSKRPATPNLDALANESVWFANAVSQASWTRPSLPTLLTGLYPSEHGVGPFETDAEGRVSSPQLAEEAVTVPEVLKDHGYATALVGEQFQLSPRFGLNQGFDFYKNRAHNARNIHDNFLRWLDREQPERWFTYLHYLEIHWPYCPPPEVRGTFNPGGSEIRWCNDWSNLRTKILDGELALTDADKAVMEARHDEELLALDRRLGDLFATLKERGAWDETMIIVTSDHGEEFFEHGSFGHGTSLYQELIAVPLVVKPPASWGVETGVRIEAPVEIRDVAATVLAVAGAPPLDGATAIDLTPWIAGVRGSDEPREFVVAESLDRVAVRSGDLKLIAARDGSAFELYDLAADPGETTNLALERRADLARLRGFAEAWEAALRPLSPVASEELDPETEEGLRALGYLD